MSSAALLVAGCGEPVTNSSVAQTRGRGETLGTRAGIADEPRVQADGGTPDASAATDVTAADGSGSQTAAAQDDPARPRTFAVEGPHGALRINFDDLDLLKAINMDDVTPDCVAKMPQWMRDLNGKTVRIRGFMKPSNVQVDLPQFLLVRSTDMCCFGPKGKVYHMAAVMLKEGTTTDYIELKPFDVVGTLRIEPIQLDDGTVFLLYHVDEATIVQK